MKLTVIGSGYVGLVAGACFADAGHRVFCLDQDATRVRTLQSGKIPFHEPGLAEMVERNIKSERLHFFLSPEGALVDSEIVFIAVGTPTVNGKTDLSYVQAALDTVEKYSKAKFVVMKSTVPVGTCEKLQRSNFEMISNPEFLKQGNAVEDFLKPERVVIGCQSKDAETIMRKLYEPFLRSGKPFLAMDLKSAELSKYAANSFLAMKISYINEVAFLAENFGADIDSIRKVLTTDSRIGSQFLYPGCGYGGSCFPKDVDALIEMGHSLDYSMPLFNAVQAINDRQKGMLFKKTNEALAGELENKKIAVWGLSFKPLTDDMREAPSVNLIQSLLAAKANVFAFDPIAMESAKRIFSDQIQYATSAVEATKGADALVVVTEWPEFRRPDFEMLKAHLKQPVIIDGRNLFSPQELREQGFRYFSFGKENV